jgi:hypothetical protein
MHATAPQHDANRTNGRLDTWDGVRTGTVFISGFGSTSYGNAIKPCRALNCRDPVSFVVVRPKRYGSLANHAKLHPSQRHGHGAGAKGEAATEAGADGKHRCSPPERSGHPDGGSNDGRGATGNAGACHGEACPARERASSCNDGCESSFRRGKDPWVGCSESAGYNSVFSATCKDTLTHRDYAQCVETKMFLGWDRQRSWWYCTGMLNGGKFRVTAENRNR